MLRVLVVLYQFIGSPQKFEILGWLLPKMIGFKKKDHDLSVGGESASCLLNLSNAVVLAVKLIVGNSNNRN